MATVLARYRTGARPDAPTLALMQEYALLMAAVFTTEQRARLRRAFQEQSTEERHRSMREEAARRGFRLAEPWEREHLDGKDLFLWRGTVWVQL